MLHKLFTTIQNRKDNPPPGSYTAQLLAQGSDAILQKIGEEAVEVILAAKGQGRVRLVAEVADLYYHTLVLLAEQGISLIEVEAELERRAQP